MTGQSIHSDVPADAHPDPRSAARARNRLRSLVIATTITLLVLFIVSAWPRVFPKNFGVVVPDKIYRSGELTVSALADVVRGHNIKTIIDMGAYEPGTPEDTLQAMAAESLGVERYVLRLEGDGSGDPTMYLESLRLMTDESKLPMLIHCGAGSERTGMLVVFYRNIVQGVEVDRAFEEAKRFSHDPRRNPRLRPLIDYILEPLRAAYENDLPVVTLPDDEKSAAAAADTPGPQP